MFTWMKDVTVGCCAAVGTVLGRTSSAMRAPVAYGPTGGSTSLPGPPIPLPNPDYANGYNLAKEDVRRAATGATVYVANWIFSAGSTYWRGYTDGLRAANGTLWRTPAGTRVLAPATIFPVNGIIAGRPFRTQTVVDRPGPRVAGVAGCGTDTPDDGAPEPPPWTRAQVGARYAPLAHASSSPITHASDGGSAVVDLNRVQQVKSCVEREMTTFRLAGDGSYFAMAYLCAGGREEKITWVAASGTDHAYARLPDGLATAIWNETTAGVPESAFMAAHGMSDRKSLVCAAALRVVAREHRAGTAAR